MDKSANLLDSLNKTQSRSQTARRAKRVSKKALSLMQTFIRVKKVKVIQMQTT